MPYKNMSEAIELSKMGKGSLVSSIATNDDKIAADYTINAATHHGRILVINRESAKQSTGHGSPLPLLVHGGQVVLEVVKKWVVNAASNIICNVVLSKVRQRL